MTDTIADGGSAVGTPVPHFFIPPINLLHIMINRKHHSKIYPPSILLSNKNLRHPSKLLYTFLEHSPCAGTFSPKTVKYFYGHMKDAKSSFVFFITCRRIPKLIPK